MRRSGGLEPRKRGLVENRYGCPDSGEQDAEEHDRPRESCNADRFGRLPSAAATYLRTMHLISSLFNA